jgi:RHS repeat-associated protein
MKRAATTLMLMLAAVASAAVVDVERASWREGEGGKTQWAPTRSFRGLNAHPVFTGERGRAASPYAGEEGETAAGGKEAGFTGHRLESALGLTYAEQRWLDSTTGTWLSRDSVGASSYLARPNELNPWQYAAGNPTRYSDPDGRDAETPLGYCRGGRLQQFGGDFDRCMAWAHGSMVAPRTVMKGSSERIDVSDVSFVTYPVGKVLAVYDEAKKAGWSTGGSAAVAVPLGVAEMTGSRDFLEWGHEQNLVSGEMLSEEESSARLRRGIDTTVATVGAAAVFGGLGVLGELNASAAIQARQFYIIDNVIRSSAASATSGFGQHVLREQLLANLNAWRATSGAGNFRLPLFERSLQNPTEQLLLPIFRVRPDGRTLALTWDGNVTTTGKREARWHVLEDPPEVGCEIHHLCTPKNPVSSASGGPWTPRFQKLFDALGASLEHPRNKVKVFGHFGPHPEKYHLEVYSRLSRALTKSPSAFWTELGAIGVEVATPGTRLNGWVTGR